MFRLRARLATALDRAGASHLCLSATPLLPTSWQRLTVLSWHRVAQDLRPGFDDGVVDATPEQFSRQVAIIKQHFSLVDVAQLDSYREAGQPLPPNPALLTFDDGYRDCLTTALPILERHNAKAVFFIPTAYMGTGRLFAWERTGAVLARCRKPEIDIDYPDRMRLSLRDDAARAQALERVVRLTRSWIGLDWPRFHDRLAAACEVDWDRDIERKLADELMLDWDGVRALLAAGMDVQSHSDTHAFFPGITAEEILREASTSRRILQEQTGRSPIALAYPTGEGPPPGHPGHTAMVQAGYKLAFTLQRGARRLGSITDWLGIPRIASEPGMGEDRFRSILAFPGLVL